MSCLLLQPRTMNLSMRASNASHFLPVAALGYDADPLPRRGCKDADEWEFVLECLSTRILWDSDYAMGYLFMDDAPERSSLLRSMVCIDRECYTAIPPDPTAAELKEIRKILKRLVRRKR
jgi:hypothetical protein